MIAIQRPPAPKFLKEKTKKWFLETQEAIAHYENPANNKPFKFKAYNDPLLKSELKKVFKKCAYCESLYDHVSDGDIEHFRPKGQVNEKNPQSPGYYWLANNWDNLLLSCMHCNQRRKHQLYSESVLYTRGKLDQFPLSDEGKRINNHKKRSLAAEERVRLLLNPCKDNPEKHFKYEMEEGVIIPITEMAKKSIEVYVLQRVNLVKERKNVLVLLFTQMDRVLRELERFSNDQTPHQKAILQREMEYLIEFTKEEKPYAGMCRYFVRTFLSENKIVS